MKYQLIKPVNEKYSALSDFEQVDELSKVANVAIPNAIEEIRNAPVRHTTVCEVDEMKATVIGFLGI